MATSRQGLTPAGAGNGHGEGAERDAKPAAAPNKNGLHRCKPFSGEFMVAQGRIELPTRGFSIRCSTN